MKDSPHNYKMSDIRKCFSNVGDTTLSKWLDKGLIPHQSDKKGIRTNIRYSALEIVHVGILAQLSTWGVLTYYKDATTWGGLLTAEDILSTKLGRIPSVPSKNQCCYLSLIEPNKMVEYYRSYGPQLMLIVTARQFLVEQEDKRMRRTKTVFFINVLGYQLFREWRTEVSLLEELEAKNKQTADVYLAFGHLQLEINTIIHHVYNQLDILSLLD
jgi:hypothetical protein